MGWNRPSLETEKTHMIHPPLACVPHLYQHGPSTESMVNEYQETPEGLQIRNCRHIADLFAGAAGL